MNKTAFRGLWGALCGAVAVERPFRDAVSIGVGSLQALDLGALHHNLRYTVLELQIIRASRGEDHEQQGLD